MPLHTDFRPKSLEEFYGNEETINLVRQILKREESEIPHSFLLVGPRGCGKTTLARIIAKQLGCDLEKDFMELNTASFRGIDTSRDIINKIQFKPLNSKCRVWFLDECHQLTKDAQEALLKVVEQPPSHVYFIFSTTEPYQLKPTLRDRCIELKLGPLSYKECITFLVWICKKINKRIPLNVLEKIYDTSEGRPRSALILLERILDVESSEEMLKIVSTVDEQIEVNAVELCRLLIQRASWDKIVEKLKQLENENPEGIRRLILKYFTKVLLSEGNRNIAKIMMYFMEPYYNSGFAGLVLSVYGAVEGLGDED